MIRYACQRAIESASAGSYAMARCRAELSEIKWVGRSRSPVGGFWGEKKPAARVAPLLARPYRYCTSWERSAVGREPSRGPSFRIWQLERSLSHIPRFCAEKGTPATSLRGAGERCECEAVLCCVTCHVLTPLYVKTGPQRSRELRVACTSQSLSKAGAPFFVKLDIKRLGLARSRPMTGALRSVGEAE